MRSSPDITGLGGNLRPSAQKYCKYVIVQKRAVHPNIVPFEGVAPKLFGFCTVTQWMEHENILKYIGEFPGANRLDLVCFSVSAIRL